MTLAVFIDLVGQSFEAPILLIDQRTAIVFQDCAKMLDQPFGLRVGQILSRNENMLVQSHVSPICQRASKPELPVPDPDTRGNAIDVLQGRAAYNGVSRESKGGLQKSKGGMTRPRPETGMADAPEPAKPAEARKTFMRT